MTLRAIKPTVEMVPTAEIDVVNPRVRNQKTFRDIVSNIANIGLKRPITVTRTAKQDGPKYELVCGQGRLEAYKALGQTEIPAIVVEASSTDAMVMSLVENVARRQHRSVEIMQDIEGLKRRGYNEAEIAKKTDLSVEYVKGIIRLVESGEDRLLRAVETKQIPVSVAVEIASAEDGDVQRVLQQAYDEKLLRGNRLTKAKRIIEQRRRRGKTLQIEDRGRKRPVSLESVLKAYREDSQKKRALVRKADMTKGRLVFVVEALRSILADDHFTSLLEAEGLHTLPKTLCERIALVGGA